MDWNRYKELSHHPAYFTRWALDHTVRILGESASKDLLIASKRQPLEKPRDHKGGAETDVFELELNVESVRTIISLLKTAQDKTILQAGSLQPNLNALLKSWEEYADWLVPDG